MTDPLWPRGGPVSGTGVCGGSCPPPPYPEPPFFWGWSPGGPRTPARTSPARPSPRKRDWCNGLPARRDGRRPLAPATEDPAGGPNGGAPPPMHHHRNNSPAARGRVGARGSPAKAARASGSASGAGGGGVPRAERRDPANASRRKERERQAEKLLGRGCLPLPTPPSHGDARLPARDPPPATPTKWPVQRGRPVKRRAARVQVEGARGIVWQGGGGGGSGARTTHHCIQPHGEPRT